MSEKATSPDELSAQEKRALLEKLLKEKAAQSGSHQAPTDPSSPDDSHTRSRSVIPRLSRGQKYFPLSSAQQRLWLLDQLDPGNPVYNISILLRLKGELDLPALEGSLAEIQNRHEILRANFTVVDGKPVQHLAADRTLPLLLIDLRDEPETSRLQRVEELAETDAQRSFDLEIDSLARVNLFRLKEDDHLFQLVIHHIVFDGWSLSVFLQELTALYTALSKNEKAVLPSLPVQYIDFAGWEAGQFEEENLQEQIAYWKNQLGGDLPVLEMPLDKPRPDIQSFRAGKASLEVSPALTQSLNALSRQEGVTLFVTMLSVFYVLLARYAVQEDIIIGTPIARRSRAEVEKLIGVFLNNLALRTDLSGNINFRELLKRVRRTALDAFANQEVPFEKLLNELRIERDSSHSPVFQVFFNLLDVRKGVKLELPNLVVETPTLPEIGSIFDITLYAQNWGDTLKTKLVYNADLFDTASMDEFLQRYHDLLEMITANPDQGIFSLPISSQTRQKQASIIQSLDNLSNRFTPFGKEDIQQSLPSRFEGQVEKFPEHTAVKTQNHQWTYEELNRAANHTAHYILEKYGPSQQNVALLFDHDAPMIAGLLGVLKAGKTYIPLDPNYPQDRLAYILKDTRANIIVTNNLQLELAQTLSDQNLQLLNIDDLDLEPASPNPGLSIPPQALAYILYTSGSTGEPKGVLQNHRNVLHFIKAYTNNLHIGSLDRLSLLSSYSFDAAVMDIFGALLNGATLCPIDVKKEGLINLAQYLNERQITIYHSTPTVYRYFLNSLIEASDFPLIRLVVLGGEAVVNHDVELYRKHFPDNCVLVNGLGPTESTVSLQYFVDKQTEITQNSVPVGYAVEETEVILLNDAGEEAPLLGEIAIRSPYVALGYWEKPDMTQLAFLQDSNHNRMRTYRTGDMGCFLPDGSIEFRGRKDFQVKIRGHRVEVGEIETRLAGHPMIRECVVNPVQVPSGEKQLVAYFVGKQSSVPSSAELRRFLQEKLPDYMMPAAYVPLDHIPLTPTRKIDRRALPEPDLRASREAAYEAPQTQLQELLAGIWADVLQLKQVGIQDNFFELGGHSLLATQIISRVRQLIHINLPLRLVFEFPTIAAMSAEIVSLKQDNAFEVPPLKPRTRLTPPRLSFSQERIWFIHQLSPESAAYNMSNSTRIQGKLDTKILEQAFNLIIDRHEILRTTFENIDGEPVQVIAAARPISVPVINLQSLSASEKDERANKIMVSAANEPFDLVNGPLIRAFLIQLGQDDHILFTAMHHIISDQWSGGIFSREFTAIYNALSTNSPIPLADLPVQYADYGTWQRDWLQGDVLEAKLRFWKKQLDGISVLDLPTDFPRPTIQTFNGSYEKMPLSASLMDSVKGFCHDEQVTPFMFFLAVFKTMLLRYTSQQDISVGSPVANRNWLETENIMGPFINTVVFRSQPTGNLAFNNFLHNIRELSLEVFNQQDLPFEKLVEEIQPERNTSHAPLVQVLFNVQNAPIAIPQLHNNLSLTPIWIERDSAQFDLTFTVSSDIDPHMVLAYNTDLFKKDTIKRMLGHLETLVHSVLADPRQRLLDIPLLTQAERQQQLVAWNKTQLDYPREMCLHQLIEAQSEKTPDAVAIKFNDQEITYRELNSQANQLAYHLQELGVAAESPVGILMERSADMVIGLLGILKAGGTYIPLDPLFPQDRLAYMLENSQARILLSHERLQSTTTRAGGLQVVNLDGDSHVISQYSVENPPVCTQPQNLAYILYTSGSTGKPKGVQIPHRAVVNFLTSMQQQPGLTAHDQLLSVTTLSFDISVLEIFLPLITGARVVVVPGEAVYDGTALINLLSANNISIMQATPATWQMLIDAGWQGDKNLKVLCGGEAMSIDLAAWLAEHAGSVWNMYGPTETTVWSTICEITPEIDIVTIGRPIANTQTYILDDNLEPTPIGVAGELYIAGDGVARGYLAQPTLTAEKFLPDPFSGMAGTRMYKTGDQARYLEDGWIDFLGRADFQVKVRGFRIELGEIETVLNNHPHIRQAVVIAREDTPGDKRLAAYLIPEVNGQVDAGELRQYIRTKLPEYMMPSSFMFLDEFPMTPNRKVNRKALPAPDPSNVKSERDIVPPETETEVKMAGIWTAILGIAKIDVHDNFFELGGHSLLATRVISQIRKQFQVDLPLRTLFMTPTIAEVSEAVDTILWATQKRSVSSDAAAGKRNELEI